jgi:hypothetical protein
MPGITAAMSIAGHFIATTPFVAVVEIASDTGATEAVAAASITQWFEHLISLSYSQGRNHQ